MLDTFPLIDRLNLDFVDEEGYTSLKCNWLKCPDPQVEPELGFLDSIWDIKGMYASAFQLFFPNETIPNFVSGPCYAQFAVTKDTVRRLPIAKYEQIRQWLWNQEGDEYNYKSGIVLEYMWHIIFGKPAFFCPPAKECYCKKWGLCDLQCRGDDEEDKRDAGWCLGRMWLNWRKQPPGGLPHALPVCLGCIILAPFHVMLKILTRILVRLA